MNTYNAVGGYVKGVFITIFPLDNIFKLMGLEEIKDIAKEWRHGADRLVFQ